MSFRNFIIADKVSLTHAHDVAQLVINVLLKQNLVRDVS